MRVAVFTDADFDRTNSVTTTLHALLRHAPPDVRPRIYTLSDLDVDESEYRALRSPAMPLRIGGLSQMHVPRIRELERRLVADEVCAIHVTTPGPAGLAARYLAYRTGLPLVGSRNRDDLFSVTSLKHYPYVANSDFHKAKHLYSWKTLLRCDKTWPAIKRALRSNVDIALTLFRNGAWRAS